MSKISDDFVVIGNLGGYYDESGKFIVCEEYVLSDDDSSPCDECDSSDCNDCEFASFENMMSHLFHGDLNDLIIVGDDENDI